MPAITIDAPAKVNLTLEVLRRRPDGFHDLRTVMQAITLADRLSVSPSDSDDLSLACSVADLVGPQNLAWRAADLLRRESGTRAGARLRLEKRVPVAAGLGGGSSDAASTLLALNALWGLGLSRADLCRLGARLGSDVPFFLGESACALAEGRGERVTPLPALAERWVVLAKAPLAVSTAAVFNAFPPQRWSEGRRTAVWLEASGAGEGIPLPWNDLEPVTLALYPGAGRGRGALVEGGAPGATLSGTGPTYFALFEDEPAARAVYDRLAGRPGAGVSAHIGRFGGLASC